MGLKPAIFLDRDGVLNVNRQDYVKNVDELELFPWTTAAMRFLAPLDAYIFIFTNQSAIGRGLLSMKESVDINNRLVELIETAGGRIDDVFICPHLVKTGCQCRKPKSGLIFQALCRYPDTNMDDITLVGDQISDLAVIPGSKTTKYLVQSGLSIRSPYLLGKSISFLPSILEVAKEISKCHAAKRSNITASPVNST